MDILKKKDNELPGVQEWWVGMKRKEDDIEKWVWTDSSLVDDSYLWVERLLEDQDRMQNKFIQDEIILSESFIFTWINTLYWFVMDLLEVLAKINFSFFLIQEERSNRRMIGAF